MTCLIRRNLDLETTINAPYDIVWESLTDIDCWKWNEWVRLDADLVLSGCAGKAKLCRVGSNRWKTSKFNFGEISRKKLLFTWTTKLRLATYNNSIQLIPIGPKTTLLRHTISVRGVLCERQRRTNDGGVEQSCKFFNRCQRIQCSFCWSNSCGTSNLDCVCSFRSIFCPWPDGWCSKGIVRWHFLK